MNRIDQFLNLRRQVRKLFLGLLWPSRLAAEDARRRLNDDVKEHWKPHQIELYELILENWEPDGSSKEKWFIVFIDIEYDVDWITNFEMTDPAQKCVSFADSVGARRCKHLPQEQVLEFKRLVGQAIVNGIRGEADQSCKLAENAAEFLKDRTVERSRYWTLVSANIFVLVLSGLLQGILTRPMFLDVSVLFLPSLAIQGGILGAYLSLIQKAGHGEWDAAAGLMIHHLEVLTKLLAGAALGGVAFALSRSVCAPPSIREFTSDEYSIFVLGIGAGWLERLIPKMISTYLKFEKP